MSEKDKASFADPARGLKLTLEDGAPQRLDVGVTHAGVEMRASVTLKPGSDLPLLVAAAHESGAPDENRQRAVRLPQRAEIAFRRIAGQIAASAEWLVNARENTNHTFDLTPRNQLHLAHLLALVTGKPFTELKGYIAEPAADSGLLVHIAAARASLPPAMRATAEPVARFGRRLGWYALVRALKPTLVIETGIDKGLGGVLICAALLRNAAEGRPGIYVGTDINPDAGFLVSGPYKAVGHILYGDSLTSLAALHQPIDMFINDSDHDPTYEAREYRAVAAKLHPHSVILSDNAHSADALAHFAEETGRRFVFFREQPSDHWYYGGGIGIAF